MRIMILGLGKSGTTAMVYKISGGLPNCQAFSGGKPGKYLGDYENAVYKHTYEERKGKSFDLYREHLSKQNYDRKIWMARDPRDAAVSRMLYRWHRGYFRRRKQYEAHLKLVLKKEQDPKSVPFYEICRYTGYNGWPRDKESVYEEENIRYRQMLEFVASLGDDWFMFRYEDMVDKKFDTLNAYLGFETESDAEVPSGTGRDKVVRKKTYGDWRHWYTEDDVSLFKLAYVPYMKAVGYDHDDWDLSPEPIIEPEFSSQYMQSLARKAKKNLIMRFLNNFSQRFFSG